MERHITDETVARTSLYRFAVKCTATFLSGVLLISLVIWLYSYREPAASYAENYRMLARLRSEIVCKSLIIYAVTSLFIIGGTAVLSLLYSHKVAGPLYKLGMFVRKTALGDFSGSVTFRRNDIIHPLAGDVNAVIASYRETVAQLEAKSLELKVAARVLSDSDHSPSPEELQKALEHISVKAGEIRDILYRFRL